MLIIPLHPHISKQRLHQIGRLGFEIRHQCHSLVEKVEEVINFHDLERFRSCHHVTHIPRC